MSASPSIPLPRREYAGYIFDHDGTLVHSMALHFEAWIHAYRKNGAGFEFTRDLARSLAGVGMVETVELLNRRFDDRLDPHAVVADQESYYLSHLDRVRPNAPLIEFARTVSRTRPVSVATGSLRDTVHRTMSAAGILDLFPVIVTVEDVVNGKPAPDLFLLAAERMGVAPGGCLVYEDGELGAQGARAAGMDVIMVEPG